MINALKLDNKDAVIKNLEDLKRGIGDARPFWRLVTPQIIDFVNQQFHLTSDTGKLWRKLNPKYKEWKQKKGFYTAIGVRKGWLRAAAGQYAKREYREKELIWSVDNSIAEENRKQYAKYFNEDRPIYTNVVRRANAFFNTDIKNFNGGSNSAFTYIWLRKQLERFHDEG